MTSYQAYKYCRDVKDTKEIRRLITDSEDALWYCENVKDIKSIRKLITDSFKAYLSGDCDDYKSYGDWWQDRKKDNFDNDNI